MGEILIPGVYFHVHHILARMYNLRGCMSTLGKVNTVVCSADRWRLEALLSGTWSLPKQTKLCV